jgi:hypothetical protein
MSGHKFLSASEAAELRGCTVDDIMRWVMEDHTLSAMLVSSRGDAVAFKLGGLAMHTVNEAGQVTDLRTGKSAGNLRFEMAEIVRHLAEWAHAAAACLPSFYLGPPAVTCAKETVNQRRDRQLEAFEAEEKYGKRGALTRLATREGVDRANMKKDIDKARVARSAQTRAGNGWGSQLVQDGKRKG